MDEHRKTRRRHSTQFKSEVLAACREPGASVAAVALSFGLNANLVRQWLRGRGVGQAADGVTSIASPQGGIGGNAALQEFVALALPGPVPASTPAAPLAAADIRIEVRRGGMQVSVSWPQSTAADCGAWLRELLR